MAKKCKCGGCHGDYHLDEQNMLGLENLWSKKPTKEDLKVCKLCWFEARNGHAITCPLHEKT